MEKVTVACVYWQGDFRNRPYSPKWVYNLKEMVERHLTLEHEFVCFSNISLLGIRTIPLKTNLRGWWSKLEMFRPDIFLGDRVLYLDLDTILVESLDPFFSYNQDLVAAPHYVKWTGGQIDQGNDFKTLASSVLLWTPGTQDELFTRFLNAKIEDDHARYNGIWFRGDQDWISFCRPNVKTFPSTWFIKLRFCQNGPPSGVKLIASMPWKNEEASEKFEWVRNIWK